MKEFVSKGKNKVVDSPHKIPPITQEAINNYFKLIRDMDEGEPDDEEFSKETYSLMVEEIKERWPILHRYMMQRFQEGNTDFAAGIICTCFTMMFQEAAVEMEWESQTQN
jgi:hypothetical protein